MHTHTGRPARLVTHCLLWSRVVSDQKLKLTYDQQSVFQSVLVSGAHLGPATNLSFSLRFSFRQLLFVIL
jgi:hypothetical protein